MTLSTLLLAQGKTQGSMLQQCTNKTLTTVPFGNTCEADAVSLEVAIGGCRTQVSTTRENSSRFKETTNKDIVIIYLF
jgi:hypothetical protein